MPNCQNIHTIRRAIYRAAHDCPLGELRTVCNRLLDLGLAANDRGDLKLAARYWAMEDDLYAIAQRRIHAG